MVRCFRRGVLGFIRGAAEWFLGGAEVAQGPVAFFVFSESVMILTDG